MPNNKLCYLLTLFFVHTSWSSEQNLHIRSAIETEASKYLDPAPEPDASVQNPGGHPDPHVVNTHRWDAADFPAAPNGAQKTACEMAGENDVNVCNPSLLITKDEAIVLNNKIKSIRAKTKCQCDSCSGNTGKYNIGIAISRNIVSDFANHCATDRVRVFATELRAVKWNGWVDSCNDSMVIGLSDGNNVPGQGSVFTSTGAKVRSKISDDCVQKIFNENSHYFRDREYAKGLEEMLIYYENALTGGKCGKRSGGTALSTGAIIGIVFGCLAGVALIIGLIMLIVTKCKD